MNSLQMEQPHLSKLSEIDIGEQIKKTVQSVSKNSHFQKRMLVFFVVVSFFTMMQTHSSNFFYMNPVFTCEGVQGKATEEYGCDQLNFCTMLNSGTLTSQLHLYCDDRKEDRTLLQTTASFGNLLGLLVVGWFSDRKGRKMCFCVGLLLLNLTCICQLFGVHANNVTLLLLSQFVAGVSSKMVYLSFLVILTRFLKKEGYEVGTIAWLIVSNGISQMAIAGIIQLFGNWRALVYTYTLGIFVCSILSLFILKEDPVYLFDAGKLKESKEIIEQIGVINGQDFNTNQANLKQLDNAFELKMLKIEHQLNGVNKFSLKDIMRCDIFQIVLIIGLSGCCYHIASKSIDLSIQSLKLGYTFNLFVVGLSNTCGFASAIYILKIESQRKRGLIYTSFLYGIIAMLFLFPFCTQNGSIQTAVIFCLRFFLCWSCNFYTRIKVDSFPEKYQMTLLGLIELLINMGNIVSPTFIQMSIDHKINPIISSNILRLIVGTLPVFLLTQQRIHLNSSNGEQQVKKSKELAN